MPNNRIQILILHSLELLPINNIIRSAKNHINEKETRRLYQDPFGDRWTHRSWFSFNDQLDQFYDQCLTNKFGPWNIHYFLTKRSTINESNAFEHAFKCKEESRFTKRLEKAEMQHEKKLHEFDRKTSQENWSKHIRRKHRKVFNERLRHSKKQIKLNKSHALKYPDFLDHQIFQGSRITIDWSFVKEDRCKIMNKMKRFMENIWPYKTPYEMHLKLLEVSRIAKSQIRENMMLDINQQLRIKKDS